jgi:hypothetical protein
MAETLARQKSTKVGPLPAPVESVGLSPALTKLLG